MNQSKEQTLIQSMEGDQESAKILSEYLGYKIGKNPVDPEGNTRIFFTGKDDEPKTAVLAVLPLPELTTNSTTVDIRKLYEKVIKIKDTELSVDFTVPVIGFIGKKRLVFFKTVGGNRDTRLDLNPETIDKDLYIRNFSYLKNDSIVVETSPFGFGAEVKVNDAAFRRELSSSFLTMVSMYRKKLSEWITATNLKNQLYDLVDDQAKESIKNNDINTLAQNESYNSVLSTVVDTISLRQLMRRFLEGYYGADSFNVKGIALGVGSGTLDEAIERAVTIAKNVSEEKQIKKLNRKKVPIGQLDLFDVGFTDEELDVTSRVEVKEGQGDYLANLSQKANEQFRLAYGGDLFAGSIGKVATKIDHELAKKNTLDWVKPYIDTKAGNYSFRFEDMPPEAIEKQYEDSMSQNVQISFNKDKNQPEVFFGDDEVERKTKGAYYTDQRFVEYMVNNTVNVEFQKRYQIIRKNVKNGNVNEIDEAIKHLLDLKIADFSCGGGSFLRGAFLKLADQFQLLNSLDYPQEIKDKYNFLDGSEDSQYQWEDYVLKHMIYGVDIDYKAIIISSLTLTLSTLQHKPKNTKLPQLIGRTLIHQNSLINAVPYYKREEVFAKYKDDIAKLRRLKFTNFDQFIKLRDKLTDKVIPEAGDVANYADFLKISCIEFALPEIYFNEDGSLNIHGGMDIVIGNPPWEIWKPNSDEFFSEYDPSYRKLPNKTAKKKLESQLMLRFPNLNEKWAKEQDRMKAGSKYFRSNDNFQFQSWKVGGRKTSSDLNLYKISLERFTQLANSSARFSILVPDNFATDNGSTGLRHLVIDKYNLQEFLSFENRSHIFNAVDERYKFACLSFNGGQTTQKNFKAFFYKRTLADLLNESVKLNYPLDFVKSMEPERYGLVEAQNQKMFDLFKKIRLRFPDLQTTKLLKVSRDFDANKEAKKFEKNNNENNQIPVYEGRAIEQFTINPKEVNFAVKEKTAKDKVGNDYKSYRIAFRNIASSTNRRSLIATLLPPNSSGNYSVWIQRNSADMNISTKLFIVGIMNSYTIDFMIRQLITMNINLPFSMQMPIPIQSDVKDANNIIQIVKELLKENAGYYAELDQYIPGNLYAGKNHNELVAELNARVFIDFGITREESIFLLKTFESKTHKKNVQEEAQRILNVYDRLIEGANND
ncbi:Eco57I restriction-modification methylase domain-containing protein [Limosilactobacillus reuteri]|uniref:Eco57I restriction-modification methylase domain-containing protein n=1 Tax=Limosilactobacillus reuteri TaxID=1598 RepID=UPI002AABDAF6|nr:restriction endonuclease [Limosilactobacillus reuteri]WPU43522.1 restriction endonuclease [Limosilactobacillus reuteri]